MSSVSISLIVILCLTYITEIHSLDLYQFGNFTHYRKQCEILHTDCIANFTRFWADIDKQYNLTTYIIKSNTNKNSTEIEIISDAYYYIGLHHFLAVNTKYPELPMAWANLIISSYWGNPKSQYKWYLMISSNLIDYIINTIKFNHLIKSIPELNYISSTLFINNFKYNSEEIRTSIALSFLYSSSLSKYNPALITMANRINKGYGFEQNCTIALQYYLEAAFITINSNWNDNHIHYYEYISLEKYEYITRIFDNKKDSTISDWIDVYKTGFNSSEKKILAKQIGIRYWISLDSGPDYLEAIAWFNEAITYHDSESLFFLGEFYWYGLGVDVDYKIAYDYFTKASKKGVIEAYSSIGYMHYYGLFVEQDTKKAFEYFQMSMSKDFVTDAYYNMITWLLGNGLHEVDDESELEEDVGHDVLKNNNIEMDLPLAYKYSNFLAAKGHTYGTYWFAMMNNFHIGTSIVSCSLNIDFFKNVAIRHHSNQWKYNTAVRSYKEKKYQQSYWLFMELAEEGIDNANINAGIIVSKYDIFHDKKYQKFMEYKHLKAASEDNDPDIYGLILWGDYYMDNKEYTEAIKVYKKAANKASGDNAKLYISHIMYKFGVIEQHGYGVWLNDTKAENFYEKSIKFEGTARYPIYLRKFSRTMKRMVKNKLYWDFFLENVWYRLIQPGLHYLLGIMFLCFYLWFLFDLQVQKNTQEGM